ncbi:hypothetical protein PIB30_087386, partial [Stylosanthes scabra]|nr:hypothetical protein [Stylosanthes scabra]
LDGLSPKGSKPLLSNDQVVELAPIRRDIELTALELAPFFPSVAFRDQSLRSSAHFNPWPRHKMRKHEFRFQLRRDTQVFAMCTHVTMGAYA